MYMYMIYDTYNPQKYGLWMLIDTYNHQKHYQYLF
jgi:hypothetical protein